jgi:hypothetical protein
MRACEVGPPKRTAAASVRRGLAGPKSPKSTATPSGRPSTGPSHGPPPPGAFGRLAGCLDDPGELPRARSRSASCLVPARQPRPARRRPRGGGRWRGPRGWPGRSTRPRSAGPRDTGGSTCWPGTASSYGPPGRGRVPLPARSLAVGSWWSPTATAPARPISRSRPRSRVATGSGPAMPSVASPSSAATACRWPACTGAVAVATSTSTRCCSCAPVRPGCCRSGLPPETARRLAGHCADRCRPADRLSEPSAGHRRRLPRGGRPPASPPVRRSSRPQRC